jgi:hypothetical protein
MFVMCGPALAASLRYTPMFYTYFLVIIFSHRDTFRFSVHSVILGTSLLSSHTQPYGHAGALSYMRDNPTL